MAYQLRPEASAVKPASAPSWVAVMPAGGAAGVSSPRMPSHQVENGTIARLTTSSTSSSTLTSTQLVSSSAREIFRATTAIRNTTNSSPIASHLTDWISPGSCTRPVIRANMPWPAAAAQPPKMKAK